MRLIWAIGLAGLAAICASAAMAKSAAIKSDSKTCNIDMRYPVIGHPAIDADVAAWVKELADDFEDGCASAAKDGALGPGGKFDAELSYEIQRNDARALSVSFNFYTYSGGAHPNTQQYGQTFLKPDGRRVFIAELIGLKGIQDLSAFAIKDLKRQWGADPMSDDDWVARGAGPKAPNFEDFIWTAKGDLVIQFSPYQVAAYAAGPQSVIVPEKVVKGWLRPDPRAPQPSFDCTRSRTAIEYALCADWRLARADRQMAEEYRVALDNAYEENEKRALVKDQRSWLAARNRACERSRDMDACLMPLIAQRRARIAAPRKL